MLNLKEIEIQNIDHLGIVAGIIDSIGLVEIINELIGPHIPHPNCHKGVFTEYFLDNESKKILHWLV
jgi:hypothetical protein